MEVLGEAVPDDGKSGLEEMNGVLDSISCCDKEVFPVGVRCCHWFNGVEEVGG